MIDPSHWYLLPVGLGVASVAMAVGISGSNFWLPLFLVALSLPPRIAFWMALATMVFGSGSGVVRNLRAKTIDGRLAGHLLLLAGPAAMLGSFVATLVPAAPLLVLFALIAALSGVRALRPVAPVEPNGAQRATAERMGPLRIAAGVGGLLQGLVATGCGTLLLPALLEHRRAAAPRLVGTSVLVVFVSAIAAALARLDGSMLAALAARQETIVSMLAFAAPGVVLGGQLGPRIAQRLPRRTLRRCFGVLLLLVAVLVVVRAFGA
ncbi:MAG: sulfite exporter TauE/SafE family protein [Myxococcota bacterium]